MLLSFFHALCRAAERNLSMFSDIVSDALQFSCCDRRPNSQRDRSVVVIVVVEGVGMRPATKATGEKEERVRQTHTF